MGPAAIIAFIEVIYSPKMTRDVRETIFRDQEQTFIINLQKDKEKLFPAFCLKSTKNENQLH